MSPSPLGERLARLGTDRPLSPATTVRWMTLPERDGLALADLAEELRLGDNQLRALWDWAEDIAARDGTDLAAVLDEEMVRAARAADVSRNDRLRRVREALRRRRFPQLVATEDRLRDLLNRLALPRDVRATLPSALEGDAVRFEFEVRSAGRLRELGLALVQAAETESCEEIFRQLGEAS